MHLHFYCNTFKTTVNSYTSIFTILSEKSFCTYAIGCIVGSNTNRIYLFNSAEYLTTSKTVACKQVQDFRSFDFQLRLEINLRKQEKNFKEVYKFRNKLKYKLNHFHHCRDTCLNIPRYYRQISRSRRNLFIK
jgi:hypothetical protein